MRLENFELLDPSGTIELLAHGHNWDLHNCVDFAGASFDSRTKTLSLRWVILPKYDNPWGSPGNTASACTIRFGAVEKVVIENAAVPSDDAVTVSGISMVTPEPGEFRHKSEWGPEERFHLLFDFEDRSSIEVSSGWARLERE